MNTFKYGLLGLGFFALIVGAVNIVGYLLTSLGLDKDTAGMVIMGLILLLIAPSFGELTASVFKLNDRINKDL